MLRMSVTLSHPRDFERAYDEHGRSVYAAALRILGSPAQAQDVTQDVFLRLWRKPESFDARRGGLGPYLRLMARSRALDLWREGQAAGRMTDRMVLAAIEPEPVDAPAPEAERNEDRAGVRAALRRLPQRAARGARARVLGRADGGRDRAPLAGAAGDRQEPDPARPGAVAPGVRPTRRLSDARHTGF